MKSERKIFIAFILNMFFSILEFVGGILTGSFAIVSDAVHDFGDGISIGISFFLEKISKKKPDDSHTYGYLRYSVLGSVITTVILLFGSLTVLYHAIPKILYPTQIHYDGVIVFAVIGAIVNFVAAYFTHGKEGSMNQRAVNLHMMEDVLGWVVVLIGAVVMRFTDCAIIDPILSVLVAIFILVNATKNLKQALDIFLEKTPCDINLEELKFHLMHMDGVLDVHHIHVRTIDGYTHHATLHVVTDGDAQEIKKQVKQEMKEHGISHTTIEMEISGEICDDLVCAVEHSHVHTHGHCHHHH